jgi:hypothetical protein
MYLAASFFLASPAYPPHLVKRLGSNCDPAEAEAAFLRKTRKALASNLAMAENLFDYFLASNLLARYMYYCMRYMEGHLETAGTFFFSCPLLRKLIDFHRSHEAGDGM